MSQDKPIRVAQVMGKMLGGGVEAVVMNYYRHIDHSLVQFDFLVDEDSTLVPREEIEALGGRVFVVPPYQRLPRYLSELKGLFRREGWQVVHSHINSLSVFPLSAAKHAGVPVRVAHSHSATGRGEKLPKLLMKEALRTQANRYPTHRLACGELAGGWLFGGEPYGVVRNAVDLEAFAYSSEARARVRTELGVPEGHLLVGHVGRFSPQKNQEWLCGVLSGLLARVPDACLALAGDGPDRARAEQRFAQAGLSSSVLFLGQRADVSELYSAFDAFVLPSLYEGMPLVAVEAQRSGCPCLLSDAVTREVEVTGGVRFLPLGDPGAWARELERIALEGPLDRVAAGADPRISEYNIEAAAPRLVEFYEQALTEVGA